MVKKLKLFAISQTENTHYDTYDSAIVCAFDEEDAKHMNPNGDMVETKWWEKQEKDQWKWSAWCHPKHVEVELIGIPHKTVERGVILSSFNAG